LGEQFSLDIFHAEKENGDIFVVLLCWILLFWHDSQFPIRTTAQKSSPDDTHTNKPVDHTNRPIDHTIIPRGLSREQSAQYIGISPSLFDQLVKDGRMPKPKRINARTVWDRRKLDEAFDILDDDSAVGDPWDEILT
jgi:predicted DNA-binding transcriptional regulator AlpA